MLSAPSVKYLQVTSEEHLLLNLCNNWGKEKVHTALQVSKHQSLNCRLPEKQCSVHSFTRYGLCVSHCALSVCQRTWLSVSGSSFQTFRYTRTVPTQLLPPNGREQQPACPWLWTHKICPVDSPPLKHPAFRNSLKWSLISNSGIALSVFHSWSFYVLYSKLNRNKTTIQRKKVIFSKIQLLGLEENTIV